MRINGFLYIISLTIIYIFLCGCATTNMSVVKQEISDNRPVNTKHLYKEDIQDNSKDKELMLLERGRVAQLEGDYTTSFDSFHQEIDILKNREIYSSTLPGVQINAGSLLVNDNMFPYRARLFEIEMLYLYQTYNYLLDGKFEDALVETRISDYIINEAEEDRIWDKFKNEPVGKNEESIQKKLFENEAAIKAGTFQKSNQADENVNDSQNSYESNDESNLNPQEEHLKREYEYKLQEVSNKNNREMAEALAKTKSSVLNPYVIYVSGVIHEMGGELSDAYISYKKALLLMPSNPYLQRDVVRLAIKLNKTYEFSELKKEYPEIWKEMSSGKSDDRNLGRLVVLYESDWIPVKQEVFITLGAVAIAYPIYNFHWEEPAALVIRTNKGELGQTYPLAYMGALAVRALNEEAKWRIIRQAIRVAIKGAAFAAGTTMVAAKDSDEMKLIGLGIMIASSIYNNASEEADLRCWESLPKNVQNFSIAMPSGDYKMAFTTKHTYIFLEKDVKIEPGKTTMLWLVKVGSRMIFKQLWPPLKK